MKVINAVWEKRNLGVDTYEIEVGENDTSEDMANVLSEINATYKVIKLPDGKSEIADFLTDRGYTHAEDMICLISRLDTPQRNRVEQRLCDAVTIKKMDSDDLKKMNDEIRKNIFTTDRISLDKHFGAEKAAERYIHWISDELARGTFFIKCCYKENDIGFFSLRELQKGEYNSFIGGLYKDYLHSGIGTALSSKPPEYVKALGGESVSSYVSSNNPIQIRNLIRNGYSIESAKHIFVKYED